MESDAFFDSLKHELLAKRDQLKMLIRHPKIQGDYYESLIKNFVKKHLAAELEVQRGIVYNRQGRRSQECDAIIYMKGTKPLMETDDFVIINSDDVRCVMQIKSVLTSSTFEQAVNNLQSVKKLDKHICGWIIGFTTKVLLKTLLLKAWRSRSVMFLHVFESDRKTESRSLLNSQMKFFHNAIRYCSEITGWWEGTQIYREGRHMVFLDPHKSERDIINLLEKISQNFWKPWDNKTSSTTVFTPPLN